MAACFSRSCSSVKWRWETHCSCATLHVKSTNGAAVGFYERLGFTCDPIDGFLENHYYIDGRHWHAYRYTRSLRHPLMSQHLGISISGLSL